MRKRSNIFLISLLSYISYTFSATIKNRATFSDAESEKPEDNFKINYGVYAIWRMIGDMRYSSIVLI